MSDDTHPLLTDPYQIQVGFHNQVVGVGFMNGNVNITLAVARFTPQDGKVVPDLVISARLRMDLFCMQQLHDELGRILAQNVKPSSTVQ
jgi:hypothetical protein